MATRCRACATWRPARTASPTGPQQCAWLWRELAVPVIAAVHGVAFGGGFQIALGADMRYATADTRFSVMEIKWGLVPDLAGTQLMRHLAREGRGARAHLHRPHLQRHGGATAGLRHPRVVDDPRAAAFETARGNRRQESRRHARGQAAAQSRRRDRRQVGPSGRVGRAAEADRLAQPLEAILSNLQKRAANYKD